MSILRASILASLFVACDADGRRGWRGGGADEGRGGGGGSGFANRDVDGDGYGAADDCNDMDPSINPGAAEVAGNDVDEDCDDRALCYTDVDNDGARLTTTFLSGDRDCSDASEGKTADPIDCNDGNGAIRPGVTELPADGVDQDCVVGEVCYTDADNDGARLTSTVASADNDCSDANEGVGTDPLDCADTNAAVSPAANEIVGDNIDQNCDTDETCFADTDDDGARTSTTLLSTDTDCNDPFEAVSTDLFDCDDSNQAIRPGVSEVPGDGVDQNCDSVEQCYVDADGDDARTNATVLSADLDCADTGESPSTDPVDCNDADGTISPAATEATGDSVDQDCNGAEACFIDSDDDGARTAGATLSNDTDCGDANEGATGDPLDCNDADASIRPGAAEVPGDTIDQDCDGFDTLRDADLDGFDNATDCDDDDDGVYPGASEITGDGIDQSCDGMEICYYDGDGDGYRTEAVLPSADTDCDDVGEGVAGDPLDCLDTDAASHVGALELPGDGVDQDCDGTELCFTDADDDGAVLTDAVVSPDQDCDDANEGTDTDPQDCNDANAAIRPGAPEVPGDGIDQDCDGLDIVVDGDGDGYDNTEDCNDADFDVNPGAAEVPGDGVDQSCDGSERCYEDVDRDGLGFGVAFDSLDADCSDAGEAAAPDDACPTDNPNDSDGDGVCESEDRCPSGPDDVDPDSDGVASACDDCPFDALDDSDGDGACDSDDVCPGFRDDFDTDLDGTPNGCEAACFGPGDEDGDGVLDDCDLCPGADDAVDGDGDGVPAACDPDDPLRDPETGGTTAEHTGGGTTDATVDAPLDPVSAKPVDPGCSCASGGTGTLAWWLPALLWSRRRGRRAARPE